MKAIRLRHLVFVALLATTACEQSPSAPPPTPTPTPVRTVAIAITAVPVTVAVSKQFLAHAVQSDNTRKSITLTATWTTSEATVVRVTNAGVVRGISPGVAEVRATHEGVTGVVMVTVEGPPTTFEQDYLSAIVLGDGPRVPTDGRDACPWQNRWSAFPRGATVRLRVSTMVPEESRQAIDHAVAQLNDVAAGNLRVTTELTDDPNPMPGTHEATVTAHASPQSQGCSTRVGCTFPTYAAQGVLRASRAVLLEGQHPEAFVHDIVGHGLAGLCHVEASHIGGPKMSLMSAGPTVTSSAQIARELTPLDLTTLRTLFQSSLSPGAERPAFVQAGVLPGALALVAPTTLRAMTRRD